jgi:aryl-alcohol dehydrogenase-like predicted oxidoreductase
VGRGSAAREGVPGRTMGQHDRMRFVEVEGRRLSVIGLGCWQFGSSDWGYGEDYARREAGAIVERALDLGVNLVDTAEIYAYGRSERILGEAIRSRRDEVFLATKVFPVLPFAPVVEQRARASARRLGVDTIDLYQVHWPNPVVPNGPTMDGMRRVIDDGLVRHAGVSNFPLSRWQDAEQRLGQPVITNQVQYSLMQRKPERELLPYAQRAGRVVIAYSPLAQGLLSCRYDGTSPPQGWVRRGNALFLPENITRAGELLDALRQVAKQHDATPAQVALAWVIRRPNVVAIPGASSVAQLESNVAAADLELSADEDALLTDAADRFEPRTGPATVPALARAVFRR